MYVCKLYLAVTKIFSELNLSPVRMKADTKDEKAENSEYPTFTSSYFIDRNETMPGRINVKLADSECSTDYYLVCLECDKKKYEKLFNLVNENTVK